MPTTCLIYNSLYVTLSHFPDVAPPQYHINIMSLSCTERRSGKVVRGELTTTVRTASTISGLTVCPQQQGATSQKLPRKYYGRVRLKLSETAIYFVRFVRLDDDRFDVEQPSDVMTVTVTVTVTHIRDVTLPEEQGPLLRQAPRATPTRM